MRVRDELKRERGAELVNENLFPLDAIMSDFGRIYAFQIIYDNVTEICF